MLVLRQSLDAMW